MYIICISYILHLCVECKYNAYICLIWFNECILIFLFPIALVILTSRCSTQCSAPSHGDNNLLLWPMQSHPHMIKLICVCLLGEIKHYPFLEEDTYTYVWSGGGEKKASIHDYCFRSWPDGSIHVSSLSRYTCSPKIKIIVQMFNDLIFGWAD